MPWAGDSWAEMSNDAVDRCLTAIDANICSYAKGGEKRIAEVILELISDVSVTRLCSELETTELLRMPPAFMPVIRHALLGNTTAARRYVDLLCVQFRQDGREEYAAKIEKQVADVDNGRFVVPKEANDG